MIGFIKKLVDWLNGKHTDIEEEIEPSILHGYSAPDGISEAETANDEASQEGGDIADDIIVPEDITDTVQEQEGGADTMQHANVEPAEEGEMIVAGDEQTGKWGRL